jgi:NADH-quinone oxidoreductase subunit H
MTAWEEIWKSGMGLPLGAPGWVVLVAAWVVLFVVVILPGAALVGFFERKLGSDLQARVGPNRAGPAGLFQPIADVLKLLQKEPLRGKTPEGSVAWSWVHAMALYSTIVTLPLGSSLVIFNAEMSVFIPFWAALLVSLSVLLMGLSSRTVPGWYGGLRVSAQAITGAFPALIAISTAGLRAGGFRWSQLVDSQGASPLAWAFLSSPFEFVAFLVFLVSGLVLLNIPPLDGGYSVQDLHGGVGTLTQGRRLCLFLLGRFYGYFLWSLITVTLFLGGWKLPETLYRALEDVSAFRTLAFLEVSWVLLKTTVLMVLVSLLGTVTPRVRSDQITDLSWKVLGPLSFLALAGAAIWMEIFGK